MKWTRHFLAPVVVMAFCYLTAMTGLGQDSKSNQAIIQISQPIERPPTDDDPSNSAPGSVPLQPELRIKAIGKRIDIIKEIMARKQAEAAKANALIKEPDPELQPAKVKTTESNPTSAKKTQPVAGDPVSTETAPEKLPELPSEVGEAAEKLPSEKEKNELADFPISTSPMNSLELANSLFITGHYVQALKGYEALLATEKTTLDQDWLRCLAANCYRVQKDTPSAEKLYREVVSSKQKSYPSDQAKWYLDHLERRKRIQADLDLLSAELAPFQPQTTELEKADQN